MRKQFEINSRIFRIKLHSEHKREYILQKKNQQICSRSLWSFILIFIYFASPLRRIAMNVNTVREIIDKRKSYSRSLWSLILIACFYHTKLRHKQNHYYYTQISSSIVTHWQFGKHQRHPLSFINKINIKSENDSMHFQNIFLKNFIFF